MWGLNYNGYIGTYFVTPPTLTVCLLFDLTFENFDFGFVSMFFSMINESLRIMTLVLKVVIQQWIGLEESWYRSIIQTSRLQVQGHVFYSIWNNKTINGDQFITYTNGKLCTSIDYGWLKGCLHKRWSDYKQKKLYLLVLTWCHQNKIHRATLDRKVIPGQRFSDQYSDRLINSWPGSHLIFFSLGSKFQITAWKTGGVNSTVWAYHGAYI